MAHGKDAARDKRYGRRGGKWAPATAGPSIAVLRTRHQDQHRHQPCDTSSPFPYCPWCHPNLDHQEPGERTPSSPDEWEGLARMAQARAVAGLPLTPLATQALARHPNPRRLTANGYQ